MKSDVNVRKARLPRRLMMKISNGLVNGNGAPIERFLAAAICYAVY